MSKVVRFSDSNLACWSRIDMSDGSPCYISIARTGILVKKSKLGFMGAKLYDEKQVVRAALTAKALSEMFDEDITPEGMSNPILIAFTNAALHCENLGQFGSIIHEASSRAG